MRDHIDSNKEPKKCFIKICKHCEKTFTAKKPFAKYCSLSCKSHFYKLHGQKGLSLRKIHRERILPVNVGEKLRQWIRTPSHQIETILLNASVMEATQKLKELGFQGNISVQEISLSEDGSLLIFKNFIGKYHIMKKLS